jgi:predicted DNA-binding transcriptional regulator AlpA
MLSDPSERSSPIAQRPLAARVAPAPLPIEAALTLDDLACLLAASRRTVERMRAAGKLPRPDFRVGRMPRWRPETIRAWLESQQAEGRGGRV